MAPIFEFCFDFRNILLLLKEAIAQQFVYTRLCSATRSLVGLFLHPNRVFLGVAVLSAFTFATKAGLRAAAACKKVFEHYLKCASTQFRVFHGGDGILG